MKCAVFSIPRKSKKTIGKESAPQIGQNAPQKQSNDRAAQTVAMGMARGEYSSHSISIFSTYLSSGGG
eukprot:scaffold86720_cov37-Tisochrysis_lutea.AAC.1